MMIQVQIGADAPIQKLPMEGRDKAGNLYEVNNKYLLVNSKPVLPLMGEFHFSRWADSEWEEALLKMRAGGIEIVATYVFWIHHEEKQGEWDFTGSRNVRKFLELCKRLHMPVWLRIGPWAHGECRNGGFPDWLVQDKTMQNRIDDPKYLACVREFWTKLSQQTKGMMCSEGGPVLGIQLENEYGHAGGPSDKAAGMQHMMTLKKLAIELGFSTPYYTATGWGGAYVVEDEMLPVLGGYVDAPWAAHIQEMPACENFLFAPYREDENIGTDLQIEKERGYTFSTQRNPYLTAELGGGLQVTAHRRTYPFAEDIEAQTICMLGSGANLLGYYMYHGGYNPDGKYTTLQESKATGYANDLPVKSYDFQTCIRQSGKISESYRKLKKIHLMIQKFAESLAPANAYFPEVCPQNAEDLHTPRISVRYCHTTGEGFLFINNHQRLRKLEPVCDMSVRLTGISPNGQELILKHLYCADGSCAVIPFGLRMGAARLLRTNASLLTKIGGRYFFYIQEGVEPYYEFAGAAYENIVTLTEKEAEAAYLFQDSLYLCRQSMFEKEGKRYLLTANASEKLRVYQENGEARELLVENPVKEEQQIAVKELEKTDEAAVYELEITGNTKELHELYLCIAYAGDRAELYEDGRLIDDWFSNGEIWFSAMKRFGYPGKLILKIYPYQEKVYYNLPQEKGCTLKKISLEAEAILEVTELSLS